MKLNRKELKKILYDFNSCSNRLIKAVFEDYNSVLSKFINYLDETSIIHDYIVDCGECNQDMKSEFDKVQTQEAIFSLGETEQEEVRNVYAILHYIVEQDICIYYGVGMSYSHSNKFQEIVKDFNERVTMVLINHIEAYLTKIGIDMGLDEKTEYNITIRDGQVNIANDNASITASNTVQQINSKELMQLINNIKEEANSSSLSEEENDSVESSLEMIEQEAITEKPRKSFIKTGLMALKAISGTTEFMAAVAALVQFFQQLIG